MNMNSDLISRLPEEVIILICLRLDLRSLSRLEQCNQAIREKVQTGGGWKREAEQANMYDSYPFISGMLEYVSQRQIRDARAFKIILGSRKLLEDTVNTYELQFLPPTGVKLQASLDIRKILKDKSIKQLKALSRKHLMMDETEYPVMSEHRSLFHSIFHPHNLNVSRALKQISGLIQKLSFVNELKS